MNYLFYIITFLAAGAVLIVPIRFKRKLRLDFFTKQTQKIVASQKNAFFSSFVIYQAVRIALMHHNKKLIDFLMSGNTQKAFSLLKNYSPVYALLLSGFTNLKSAIRQMKALLKKNPTNSEYAAWLALLYEAQGDKCKAQVAWDNVQFKKISPYLKAQHQAYLARTALKNGDLEFASKLFYQAAGLFNKSQSFYEEAQIYLYLGTVYRVSFLYDVAETLFLSALKNFQTLKFEEGIAKTYANLGILMTGQERFEEADNYLNKSLKISENIQSPFAIAEIQDQLALLYLLQKDNKNALQYLQSAKKIHTSLKNKQGLAFNADLTANLHWQKGDFENAAVQAQKAACLYAESDNISGHLDSLYLQAQSLFKLGDDKTAESVLRKIVTQGKQDCGCFYLANAYNLLGIIFMKRKDLRRAKGLFQQSLDLEQRGVRLNALAADYVNIGLVELYRGYTEEALKNLKIAFDFAKQIEDETLCTQIQKQMDKISN